jgi:phenylacetate-CoA ligase
MSIRERLLRNAVLPLGDMAFGQRMISRLNYLEAAQWWDPAKIAHERDVLVSALISTAYEEVPFYRDLLRQNSLTPADIRGVKDLQRIPVVTKSMLRANYPALTTRSTGQKTYEAHTSGSTGENFCLLEDRFTAGWYRASLLLALGWAGWRLGEPHLQTGMTKARSLDRRLKDSLLRCHYISATDLSDATLDGHLDWLRRTKTKHLWGYPTGLYYLALRARDTGRELHLTSAVSWGDTVHKHYREAIEKTFHTRLFDTYGCCEGMHIAAQCGQGTAYHVHSLDVVVEYLDDEMVPVEPGKAGNIVVTRLHPGPMPFIRYRIGDVGVGGGGRRCPCGRGFELMDSISGREADVITTPTGNRLTVSFFTGLLEHYREVEMYQVVQESRASLVLRIVPGTAYRDSVGDDMVRRLQRGGAGDMSISIERVDEMPLPPTGKRRFIISKLTEAASSANTGSPARM